MTESATALFLILGAELEVKHKAGGGNFEIILDVRLAPGQRLKLARGIALEHLQGSVRVAFERRCLERQTASAGEPSSGVGYLKYEETDPPVFAIGAFLPIQLFEGFVAGVRGGRLPSLIAVEAGGLYYDPPGQSVHISWDNVADPKLAVTSIDLRVPLEISLDGKVSERKRVEANMLPPTRGQFEQLLLEIGRASHSNSRHLLRLTALVLVLGVAFGWLAYAKVTNDDPRNARGTLRPPPALEIGPLQ